MANPQTEMEPLRGFSLQSITPPSLQFIQCFHRPTSLETHHFSALLIEEHLWETVKSLPLRKHVASPVASNLRQDVTDFAHSLWTGGSQRFTFSQKILKDCRSISLGYLSKGPGHQLVVLIAERSIYRTLLEGDSTVGMLAMAGGSTRHKQLTQLLVERYGN